MSRPAQPIIELSTDDHIELKVVNIESDYGTDFVAGIGIGATELSATNAAIRNTEKILKRLKANKAKLERAK